MNDNHCEGISVCLFLPRNYLQNPLILSQDSVSGSPTSPSNFPPDEVSPSGSPDTLLHNPGNIETHAPDPTDTEDLLGGPNRYDSSHADDDEDTRPPSPGSADHIPPGDVEDLWMQETIHLRDLKSTADFIRGLRDITLDQGAPRKQKKDQGLFFFEMGSGHGLSTYVSRHLSIYGNGTSISE